MKQLLLRSIFGILIIIVNIVVLWAFESLSIFNGYSIQINVVISCFCLLFLEPFMEINKGFFVKIKQNNFEETDEGFLLELLIENNNSKNNIAIQINKIEISDCYSITLLSGKHDLINKEISPPESCYEVINPNDTLFFRFELTKKGETLNNQNGNVVFMINNQKRKIKIPIKGAKK
jgi:hypothetical protein